MLGLSSKCVTLAKASAKHKLEAFYETLAQALQNQEYAVKAEFKGRLTRNEFMGAATLHARQNRTTTLAQASIAVFGTITLAAVALNYDEYMVLAIVLIPFWVILWNARSIFARLQASAQWQRQPVVRGIIEGKIDDTGLTIKTSAGQSKIPWSKILGFRANSRTLLLYHEQHVYNVLPQRIFASDKAWENVQALVLKYTQLWPSPATGRAFWILAGVSLIGGLAAWLTIFI